MLYEEGCTVHPELIFSPELPKPIRFLFLEQLLINNFQLIRGD